MRARTSCHTGLLAAAAVLATLGCKSSSGTFVQVTFDGIVDPSEPIQTIRLDLALAGHSDTAVFQAPSNAGIVLPTTATLEIRSGEGNLTAVAKALGVGGRLLGQGSAVGQVEAGQTSKLLVNFGADVISTDDAGVVDSGIDGQPGTDARLPLRDGPPLGMAEAGRDGGTVLTDAASFPDLVPLGTGGVQGSGGTSGSGGAGGQDAGPGKTDGPDATVASDVPAGYQLALKPSSIDFGLWPVGSVATALSLTVTNVGSAPAPMLALFNSNGRHFPVSVDRCSGIKLDPGSACVVAFGFTPDTPGTVRSNGSLSTQDGTALSFNLSGTGMAGGSTLGLSPQAVEFSEVDVGIASSVTFTVTNKGTGPSGQIQAQVVGASSFQVVNNTCANMSLGAQGQCTFVLMFAPTTFGVANATVTVQSESGGAASASVIGRGQDRVQLAVQFAGTGTGSVSAAGTTCANSNPCSISVVRTDANAPPKLDVTAVPNAGSQFAGWSGDCSGSGSCAVVMDSNHTVTANFAAVAQVKVSINVIGLAGHKGSIDSADGTLSCTGNCPNLLHEPSSSFTLIAKPASNASFVAWTDGPCRGTEGKCTFPLTGDVNITATFGPQSYMFVSSSTVVPGKLMGVEGADRECQRLASNAGLPGNYVAWLSGKAFDARTRVGSGGWVRTDGRPFAKNIVTLGANTKQIVFYPPRTDEAGNDLGNSTLYVATGSNQDGTSMGAQCEDYTNVVGSHYVGNAAAGSQVWSMTELHGDGCARPYHLYCFRSDALVADIVPAPQPGRRVFLSQQPYVIGNGISPDQLCRTEAALANLGSATPFVAFMATSSTPATKRLNPSGPPWKRFDEVLVARQASDFGQGKLLAPIDLAADGVSYLSSEVWTGAVSPTELGTATCGDWTTTLSLSPAIVGYPASSASPEWFNFGGPIAPCSDPNTHVLCIEP